MQIAFFDTHQFEKNVFVNENSKFHFELHFFDTRLTAKTAMLARNHPVACAFVNDCLDKEVCEILAAGGTKLLALRSAGYNHVDLNAAQASGLRVVRVPEYSPHAVAEHTVALLMSLNRKTHKAYHRVREANFSIEGLVGFDLFGKTIGVIGTGKIGRVFAEIMRGFGCKIIAADPLPSTAWAQTNQISYVSLTELLKLADVVSLHCPLTKESFHLLNRQTLPLMKPGAMLLNTGRGALIETQALIESLKSGHLGAAGLDVYEEEGAYFFKDLSEQILKDDALARLLTFPNVLITSHQAFLTTEALVQIAKTTLNSILDFQQNKKLNCEVLPSP